MYCVNIFTNKKIVIKICILGQKVPIIQISQLLIYES